jgi:hypothetical protein
VNGNGKCPALREQSYLAFQPCSAAGMSVSASSQGGAPPRDLPPRRERGALLDHPGAQAIVCGLSVAQAQIGVPQKA